MHTTLSSGNTDAALRLNMSSTFNDADARRNAGAVRRRACAALLAIVGILTGLWAGLARADGIDINHASATVVNGVVMVSADMTYHLSGKAIEALVNGVPLTFNVDVEIKRYRKWLWNQTVVSVRQSYRLEYHALSKQYLVVNLITGAHRSFQTLQDAVDGLGRIRHIPVVENHLLQRPGEYLARIQAQLDIEALPSPLSPLAYLSDDWRLSSDWYTWKLDL